MTWNPDLYLKFSDARQRPALDLLARVPGETLRHIVDLGCGTGNITRILRERWPDAHLIGVDSDAAMLGKAAEIPSSIDWQRADIAVWQAPFSPDLIYSNAALHWIDEHPRNFPRYIKQLSPGGVLAVQMPANFAAPSHRLLRELAAEAPWRKKLSVARMGAILSADEYHALLAPHCRTLDIWQTTYWQVLPGVDALVEWMKGTTLLPYLALLEGHEADVFLADYRIRMAASYPMADDGTTLFPFQRLFMVAGR